MIPRAGGHAGGRIGIRVYYQVTGRDNWSDTLADDTDKAGSPLPDAHWLGQPHTNQDISFG